ncbi:urease accessory protein UreF [Nocardiaceae bacterium YC2-7]|uniref:Urease accessory protein UreF n=2 Tax=Antrihabitans stalactiti TaxID=2584121 RepID=A0A848KHV5_9NOCA|nr:urease accessory UreF family protein [Antrihabitans stalactiti]NMN97348.1 urease accessory protein UreF [Antrihabitans stalactiti]
MSFAALLALADSRLPIGGHVHSGGVEEAIESGVVRDVATLEAFLRRRIRTAGLVGGSIAAAVCAGQLDPVTADVETDARTPSPAARTASRAQGRGLLRLAKRVWPHQDWAGIGLRPHLPVMFGAVGRVVSATPTETAAVVSYTTMTGTATAAQRLLALDPADVAALTFTLADLCNRTADTAVLGLAALSDPLLDVLAQRHIERERPLFAS